MISILESMNNVITVYKFEQDCKVRSSLLRMHNGKFGPLTYHYLTRLAAIQGSPIYIPLLATTGRLGRILTVYKESRVSRLLIGDMYDDGEVNRWISTTGSLIYDTSITVPEGVDTVLIRDYSTYLDLCFRGLERVCIARIDLKYSSDMSPGIDDVHRDLRRWLKLRYSDAVLKDDISIGYIWRIERGKKLDRYHVHVLLFYKESDRITHHLNTMASGWKKVVDGGLCHVTYDHQNVTGMLRDNAYGYSCTGIVSLNDPIAVIGLVHILLYFFKDHSKDIKTISGGRRLIGRGQLPTDVKDV